ncbi:MAG: DUF6318 family protein [Actinomycetota bacterium]|nr:DUF6318 family protein [Actinomycetota bacterium]
MKLRLAATLLALTLLAACSDDPELRVEPSESPTSPSSTSPTSEPAQVLGPEETVRAWVDARNVLMLEGDATAVEALSAPSCKTCRNSIAPLKEVHKNGGRFENDGWTVSSSRVRSETAARATVSVALVTSAGTTIPSIGAEPVSYEEENRIAVFRLAFNKGWRVGFIGYLS